jgi:hypothetical protein
MLAIAPAIASASGFIMAAYNCPLFLISAHSRQAARALKIITGMISAVI